ncbi:MAG TPA: R3H domain-containing nucleic acid-binding protein [Chthoniobacteraceae bacterium]|jgi:spoIIIJ-associated protein|nr:r3h domain [Chthoniobacter sp.]HEV7866489.1 R3H domain-containing nucleic acid-binding protein [Chthoniobacteraceae bacterium]
MLGLLGFVCEIKEIEHDHGLTLMVYTGEKDRLIGRNGELLEDIQLLLNRLLQAKDKHAGKVQVDIEHWREMRDDSLAQRVRQIGEIVRQTGRPYHLEPMNAYERRIVHHAFKDDPEIATWSPPDDARIKRITLKRRVEASAG